LSLGVFFVRAQKYSSIAVEHFLEELLVLGADGEVYTYTAKTGKRMPLMPLFELIF
jgi:hypothetical protein